MKLLTQEIIKKLPPLYATDGQNEVPVIVKFFNPTGIGTWHICEGSKEEDGDYRLFGLCEIHEKELGYVMLSELQSFRGRWGLGIERDLWFEDYVLDKSKREVRYVPPQRDNEAETDSTEQASGTNEDAAAVASIPEPKKVQDISDDKARRAHENGTCDAYCTFCYADRVGATADASVSRNGGPSSACLRARTARVSRKVQSSGL
jgi:hypothetical protein